MSSAFVEGQVVLLTQAFLEKHGVKDKPKGPPETQQCLDVLEANGILSRDERKETRVFQEARNKAMHDVCKGMTRQEWEQQNRQVVELARPIVKNLDKKLYAQK